MDLKTIEESWLEHMPELPIMMGIGLLPEQFIVNTKEEFLSIMYRNLGKDIFCSVHSVEKRKEDLFVTLYLDIDMERELDYECFTDGYSLNRAYFDTLRVSMWLEKRNFKHRVYFSGNKGFNIYIDFPETKIEKWDNKIRAFVYLLERDLKVKRIDVGVVTDKNRISRLPFTKNSKSNRYCFPIDIHTFNLNHITNTEKYLNSYRVVSITPEEKFVSGLLKIPYVETEQHSGEPTSNIETTLIYIISIADRIPAGARHNAVWKILIPSLNRLGYTPEQTQKICVEFLQSNSALNASDTRWIKSQIGSAKRKRIMPMRWDRFKKKYGIVGL